MSKPIFVDEELANSIVEEFKSEILGKKSFGEVEFSRKLASNGDRAALTFTATAWMKMTALVSTFSTEVQWHGLVHRISENEFEVYDIIVPPHVVTASTVTSDQTKYEEWINSLDDDVFADLRFHGHSHVRMAVTPSGVDMKYRKDKVTQLPLSAEGLDIFYIFLIINKDHSWSAQIFDITNNACYDTDEIDVDVLLPDNSSLEDFTAESKKVAVEVITKPAATTQKSKSSAESKSSKKYADDYYSDIYSRYGYGRSVNDPFFYEGD